MTRLTDHTERFDSLLCQTAAARDKGRVPGVRVAVHGKDATFRVAVDEQFNGGTGILRGQRGPSGDPLPDCVELPSGVRLTGRDIRLGTSAIERHIDAVADSAVEIRAAVGAGDVTQNPGKILFRRGHPTVALAGEPSPDRVYDALVASTGGRCAVMDLRFRPGAGIESWEPIDAASGQTLANAETALTGQRLVRGRTPTAPRDLATMAAAGQFYDLRHVFCFPAVKFGDFWLDVGLHGFYDSNGRVDPAAVAAAFADPVRVSKPRGVSMAETQKGVGDKATYTRLVRQRPLTIGYGLGIYPFNLIGVKDGCLVSVQITGWSNNSGTTLPGAAEIAAAFVDDAILLDEGGDVMYFEAPAGGELTYRNVADRSTCVVASCENRYIIRGALCIVYPK